MRRSQVRARGRGGGAARAHSASLPIRSPEYRARHINDAEPSSRAARFTTTNAAQAMGAAGSSRSHVPGPPRFGPGSVKSVETLRNKLRVREDEGAGLSWDA